MLVYVLGLGLELGLELGLKLDLSLRLGVRLRFVDMAIKRFRDITEAKVC